jgi:hypothetical protein
MERSASMFAGKRPMLVSRVATMFKRVRCIVTFFRLWTYEERHRKTRYKLKFVGPAGQSQRTPETAEWHIGEQKANYDDGSRQGRADEADYVSA